MEHPGHEVDVAESPFTEDGMHTINFGLSTINPASQAERSDATARPIYRVGGAAALIMVAITLGQFIVFAVAAPPLEGSAADWFALFDQTALTGLLAFEALLIVYALLSVIVALALFFALRAANPGLLAAFLVLSVMGSLAFVIARPALEMLSLSQQYAVASNGAQRAALLAAGEAMLALWHGTAFQVSYLLGAITGLLVAVAMLQTGRFSKTTAYLRLASSVLDFGIFVPGVGLFISLGSVVCLLLFNALVARRLFQLGRQAEGE
jgi:hypothetical protein